MAVQTMRRLLRPSLSRRLLLALVLAFVLVGVVLVANEYRAFRQAGRQQAALLKAGRYLAEALGHAADAQQAQLIVRVAETYFNRAREDFATERHRILGALLFQLRTADGQLLYSSGALPSEPLPGTQGEVISHEPTASCRSPNRCWPTPRCWAGWAWTSCPRWHWPSPSCSCRCGGRCARGCARCGGWRRSCSSGRATTSRPSPNT